MKNKKYKLLIYIILSIVFISFFGYFYIQKLSEKKDKELINNFMYNYFKQFDYCDKMWDEIFEDLSKNATIISIDLSKPKKEKWIYLWEDMLTKKELERLINNRLIPNLYIKEFGRVDYEVDIENIEKIDRNNYIAKINLKINDVKKIFSIKFRLKKVKNKRYIGNVNLSKVNEILKEFRDN